MKRNLCQPKIFFCALDLPAQKQSPNVFMLLIPNHDPLIYFIQ